MGLLNVCCNPVIYATKYDVVRRKLKKLVGRTRTAGQVSGSTDLG